MTEEQMVLIIALVVPIVEVAKLFGVSGKWSVLVSIFVGAVLAITATYAPDEMWTKIVPILTVGLAASGFYTLGKRMGSSILKR